MSVLVCVYYILCVQIVKKNSALRYYFYCGTLGALVLGAVAVDTNTLF